MSEDRFNERPKHPLELIAAIKPNDAKTCLFTEMAPLGDRVVSVPGSTVGA
ncbi:MAG: hypothetical protein WB509_14285 [Acetobacteraceae bacterium]